MQVECLIRDETLWLTQKAIAELFGVETPAISKHLSNIYGSNELEQAATLSILETVQAEGSRQVRRRLEHYSLDAIIAVGYRVNSYPEPTAIMPQAVAKLPENEIMPQSAAQTLRW